MALYLAQICCFCACLSILKSQLWRSSSRLNSRNRFSDVPGRLGGGRSESIFEDAGLKRDEGMTLFAKAVRPEPSGFPVNGSKIVVPVWLKSPRRISSVGTVNSPFMFLRSARYSQEAK